MKKRIFCALLCAVLLAGLIPAAALTASAATVEGDWTTYRFASEYCDDTCDHESEACYYRPEAGYKYTAEGFTVIPADYTDFTPRLSVMSKDARPLKEGIYLKFRVDDYSYDGGRDADQWIALTLTTECKAEPGSPDYGGGWLTLIRGKGDGVFSISPCLTDPSTDDAFGSFVGVGTGGGTAPRDNQGREIYTLEVTWDGSAYEMKLNGVPLPGSAETTKLLEKLDPNGEFFVGIQMHSTVKDGTAALTILEYGANAANATTPVGSDSKEPEENCDWGSVDILEPSAVPDGMPAILWSPDTVSMKDGHNSKFVVRGDNTWHVEATDLDSFMYFTPKRHCSYNAEDFPVFGILLRNFWSEGGTLWYCAGDIVSPEKGCTVSYLVYDGEFYGEDEEYVFIPIDLSDLWAGRINNIRLDFVIGDESAREFDICFAGMFRSKDEAYAYAHDWLDYDDPVDGGCPVHPGQSCECAPIDSPGQDCPGAPTEAPTESPYDPVETDLPLFWDTIPEEAITEVVSMVEDALDTREGETVDREAAVEEILSKYGCTGTVSFLAVLIPLLAVCVLKKKE